MLRRVLVLCALASPLVLVHCADRVVDGTTDDSSLVAAPDDDAGDAGDAGDAQSDAGDGGDAGDAAVDAGKPEPEPAPVPDAGPKTPTTPVTPAGADADASTTDPSSIYPDPSTVHLGPLPDGSGGCASVRGVETETTGLFAVPILAMIGLVALLRKKA